GGIPAPPGRRICRLPQLLRTARWGATNKIARHAAQVPLDGLCDRKFGGPISESAALVYRESCSYTVSIGSAILSVSLCRLQGTRSSRGSLCDPSVSHHLEVLREHQRRPQPRAAVPPAHHQPVSSEPYLRRRGGMMVVSGDVAISGRASGSSGATRAYPPWTKRPTPSVPDRVRVCGGSKTSL